jgi:short subunit dehydrogenase-like uncharacterized protein
VAERDLDVVVFGATGVTGRNVAAYLAERAAETGARWAAAARDAGKLERQLTEAGVSAPETIVADVGDPDSLAAMASRTRVVLDLVGPYTLYGRPVIEACVAAGAHYADLSGEIPFVRQIIDTFDARAREAGVKIVQICGFESLPPDLAVLLAAETARERWDEGLREVDLELTMKGPPGPPRPSDGPSGGTIQSIVAMASDEDATSLTDPGALVTDDSFAAEVRRRSPLTLAPRRGRRGHVIAPMVPAPFINPPVIHRTAALLAAEDDGGPFRYREGIALPGKGPALPLSLGIAGAVSGAQVGLRAMSRAPVSARRRLGGALRSILPGPGYGPAPDRLEGWKWRMSVDARTSGGHEVGVEVDSEGHVGYLATARMMGEAGVLLAEPGATPERAGCLTPATALGTASIERFERARLRFSVRA